MTHVLFSGMVHRRAMLGGDWGVEVRRAFNGRQRRVDPGSRPICLVMPNEICLGIDVGGSWCNI